MNTGRRGRTVDPFLLNYNASELRIASEFLSGWLPFLSRGLCRRCTQTLSDRIRSVHAVNGNTESHSEKEDTFTVSTPDNIYLNDYSDANSLGSWKDAAYTTDAADTNSLGSWRDGANLSAEPVTVGLPAAPVDGRKVRMWWADMAQEDEPEGEGESEEGGLAVNGHGPSGEETAAVKVQRAELSREQREHIRFSNVKRKKDFICLERVKGKIVNILEGLELHKGVFSAVEQKRIVDFVYKLQEMGKQSQLKERTYTAPQKWMRGKGRVTIQFGCCYNYATDKNGNPPGILQNEIVDPIPHLFKVIIRRLIGWHVLPPSCVPDSCIVNIYEEGDCIPPHIDNHDFVRPFCTVSFLSECNIVFGSNLKIVGPGEFSGSVAIPLPVGSVLVLNGNGADVAKHCVPAVPTKRISITFRKMDESKRPICFVPEPDLFLSNWLPFPSRGVCRRCTQTLSDRIPSVHPVDGDTESHSEKEDIFTVSTPDNMDLNDNSDANSLGSWKDAADMINAADTNSLGSWRDGANLSAEPVTEGLESATVGLPAEGRKVRMSWADMAQEDELESEGESEEGRQAVNGHGPSGEETAAVKVQMAELSREQREHIRFSNVKRKKDFICLERVKGKIVNVLEGLELHTGVFSAVEQKRIVDFVYKLQEMGQRGELKERTYTAPQKWMRGKGRVTIQFGCCYNYATDKNGNPPGILQNELVDPIPHLFKVIIRRLIGWHVLPPSCVPDSCIVNVYEEGDCIPPHIDNHDFVRPFCTVSFLSECNIVFGSNLKIVGPGEFSGSVAIPLPVGSVLVLNGNGADVAKHCVPAVPTKRISITFRKMDESKRPIGFVPEPDLQGLEPLSYGTDRSKSITSSRSKLSVNTQPARREDNREKAEGLARKGSYWEPQISFRTQRGPSNRQS